MNDHTAPLTEQQAYDRADERTRAAFRTAVRRGSDRLRGRDDIGGSGHYRVDDIVAELRRNTGYAVIVEHVHPSQRERPSAVAYVERARVDETYIDLAWHPGTPDEAHVRYTEDDAGRLLDHFRGTIVYRDPDAAAS